jgi:hypothetical protein
VEKNQWRLLKMGEVTLPIRSKQDIASGCVCGFTSSGRAFLCAFKNWLISNIPNHMEDDVLWEENSTRLSSDEELLMSYKKPTQPRPTDSRNSRHNEE